MRPDSLAIVGAGGHARVVAECAALAGWSRITLFDDSGLPPPSGPWSIDGTPEQLTERFSQFGGVIVARGDNAQRLAWHQRLRDAGGQMTSLIHPGATVSAYADIGTGTVVLAGARVCFGTSLGHAVIVNTNATVDHDCTIGDGVHVSPGAILTGGVVVGERGWIGAGASVRPGVTIGRDARVGMGAAVIGPVQDGQTVVGVPATHLQS